MLPIRWKLTDAIRVIARGIEFASRIYQFAKLYLFNPSSAIYTCPLAMTDGAARLLELYGTEQQKREILPRLLSRDPASFWTSGQWVRSVVGVCAWAPCCRGG